MMSFRSTILAPLLLAAVVASVPMTMHAQTTQDPLHAAIWSSLLDDPRSANIPPEQMQALVDALAKKAIEQNLSAADVLSRPISNAPFSAPTSLAPNVCARGIQGYLCAFNAAFGFSGNNYLVPLMLLVTSGLLIVIIWEMIIHHRKKLAAIKASAPPWDNMPK